MSAVLSQRTLPDGTTVQVRVVRSCGCDHGDCSHMHVGSGAVVVDLPGPTGTLRLWTSELSQSRALRSVLTCASWHEVPLAIEATRFEVLA